jgi:signal transduction histidine kinase
MEAFFTSRITHIYFIYGLGFYTLGLAVAIEASRSSHSRFSLAMWPLAAFGLAHGFHEWFEMFEKIGELAYGFTPPLWLEWARVGLLAFSFVSLISFGVRMITRSQRTAMMDVWVGLGAMAMYLVGVAILGAGLRKTPTAWLHAADVLARYTLGMTGALLAAITLLIQRRQWRRTGELAFTNYLLGAAIAFLLYGLIGQLFGPVSPLFPSKMLNQDLFSTWFGFPVQAFRAILAVAMAAFIIQSLHIFELQRQRLLAKAEQQAQDAIARRDALRGELLLRTVTAQEDERARLARELHDDTLQVLTALATGLAGADQTVATDPEKAKAQLHQLSAMSSHSIEELRRLIVALRPSVLDDMGLIPALRWYAQSKSQQMPDTHIEVITGGAECRFSPPLETTLFRIAQEALANVERHAHASHVRILLKCADGWVHLTVEDDGRGFDPAAVKPASDKSMRGWGLIGIRERVAMARGHFQIRSASGQGAQLKISMPVSFPHYSTQETPDGREHTLDID